MVLHYILQSVIHFKLIFVKGIRSVSRIFFFFFFASGCSVAQVSLVEKTTFAPLYCLCCLSKIS